MLKWKNNDLKFGFFKTMCFLCTEIEKMSN